MRSLRLLPVLFLFFAACATPRFVPMVDAQKDAIRAVAPELKDADVIVLGEHHNTPTIHRTHMALIEAVHAERPAVVIAMEMFERDVQEVLDQYLAGEVEESVFLERSRPWSEYARDYRPFVEFAKEHGLPVIAANAPRPLARKVAFEGIESVAGSKDIARETTAPEDAYWDAFVDAMGEHGGMLGEDAMARFYAAQCLKDDTMAESICDHLAAAPAGERPVVFFICGKMHSDHRRGTVQRIAQRMPELQIEVFSVQVADNVLAGSFDVASGVADYVIVTNEKPPEAKTGRGDKTAKHDGKGEAEHAGGEHEGREHEGREHADPHAAASAGAGEEAMDTSGMRPALGFMPGYGATEAGLLVDNVRPDGPAATAGIEGGDVIVELAGFEIVDINDYAEVLDELKIGSTVKVKLKRGDETKEVDVKVGMRPGR